jgi:hypothetical protein
MRRTGKSHGRLPTGIGARELLNQRAWRVKTESPHSDWRTGDLAERSRGITATACPNGRTSCQVRPPRRNSFNRNVVSPKSAAAGRETQTCLDDWSPGEPIDPSGTSLRVWGRGLSSVLTKPRRSRVPRANSGMKTALGLGCPSSSLSSLPRQLDLPISAKPERIRHDEPAAPAHRPRLVHGRP